MNRRVGVSLAGKGLLAACAVALVMNAERPVTQPLGQMTDEPAERIRLYEAQPVGGLPSEPAAKTLDFTQIRAEKRWVF